MIETQGYYSVFILTFWLGGIAVALSAFEWFRQSRMVPAEPLPAE